LGNQTRDNVGRAARRLADDDFHRPRWIGLRPHRPRDGRQCDSGCGQTQKISAGRFQFETASVFSSLDRLVNTCDYLSALPLIARLFIV
jgi:hypothetical protein